MENMRVYWRYWRRCKKGMTSVFDHVAEYYMTACLDCIPRYLCVCQHHPKQEENFYSEAVIFTCVNSLRAVSAYCQCQTCNFTQDIHVYPQNMLHLHLEFHKITQADQQHKSLPQNPALANFHYSTPSKNMFIWKSISSIQIFSLDSYQNSPIIEFL